MKVKAEVKITVLDGEEEGKVHTFTTIGHTQASYEEDYIVEQLRLVWNYIHPYRYDQESILDKIRDDIVHLHDWAFDREEILKIIDKYREPVEEKSCSNCKFWCLDANDKNRRCKYCYNQDEWQSESEG